MARGAPRVDAVGLALAAAKLAVQLLALRPYGYFRDELYYLACSDHLAWGYVDHPPLSIAVLRIWRGVFGDSLVAIRLFPALAEAAVVYLGYGDEDSSGAVVLLGGPRDRLEKLFESLALITTLECRWCMPYENHKAIYVGRGMRKSWAEVWVIAKHFE